jgi:hypothetical protein
VGINNNREKRMRSSKLKKSFAAVGVLGLTTLGTAVLGSSPASAHGFHWNPCPFGSAWEYWSGHRLAADWVPGGHDAAIIGGNFYVYHSGTPVFATGDWCTV